MSRSSHVQMVCQAQIGHLTGRFGIGPNSRSGRGNFHFGIIKFFFSVVRMIIISTQMFATHVGLNASDAFDGGNSAAGVSALIDHFLWEQSGKIGKYLTLGIMLTQFCTPVSHDRFCIYFDIWRTFYVLEQ